MPTVPPGSKILVTGANGFIPVWTVKLLLERGYAVRASVRSLAKGAHLKELFKEYDAKGMLEVVVVEDITKEGAFDEAVKGVQGIEHMASPFVLDSEDPEHYIKPAIAGTLGLLTSALTHGSSTLKRVVITSSCGAVFVVQDTPRVFTEADWNEQAIQMTEELGTKAHVGTKYAASKTLAERRSREWFEEHRASVGWDVVWVLPPFVFGVRAFECFLPAGWVIRSNTRCSPPLQEIPGNAPEKLNTSMKSWYDTVVANVPGAREALAWGNAWVDVRDVAEAHVLALEKEEAGGERIIVCSGSFVWQEWLDTANAVVSSGSVYTNKTLPKGFPDINDSKVYMTQYDTSKERRILGLKYKTMEETTRDVLEDFQRRGW